MRVWSRAKVRFSPRPNHMVEQHLTIVDFQRRGVDACFDRLAVFRKEALERLADRFPTLGTLEDLGCLSPAGPLDLHGANPALRRLADFYRVDRPAFVLDCERLLVALHKRPEADWPSFLASKPGFSESALWAVYTYLLAQSESASCERVFARVANLTRTLREQGDGQLLEQYVHISNGPEIGTAAANVLLDQAVAKFLGAKERRQASAMPGTWYRKGSKVFLRRRQQRTDAGTRRQPYKLAKRHARLRAEPAIRGLRRNASDPAAQPAARMEAGASSSSVPAIQAQMSPIRPKRRKLLVAVSEDST